MSIQQQIVEQLNNEVQAILHNWVDDLIEHHDLDREKAKMAVIDAAKQWSLDVDELI